MNFELVAEKINVAPLLAELTAHPELFGVYRERQKTWGTPEAPIRSPHHHVDDIWVRHNDRTPFDAGERPWSEFNDPHESVWYPCIDLIPSAKAICEGVAAHAGGKLGGVLITRLAPGKSIDPHTDHGWHAEVHDKYFVAIQSEGGSAFGFPDGIMHAKTGDVWKFENNVPHWIFNGSKVDRIAMIVSVRKPTLDEIHDKMTGTFEVDLHVQHNFLGATPDETDLYAKRMVIPKGFAMGTHAHTFDHMSVLAKGKVRIDVSNTSHVRTAPAYITIAAGQRHRITAIEDAVWYCVHATNENDPDRIDDALTG